MSAQMIEGSVCTNGHALKAGDIYYERRGGRQCKHCRREAATRLRRSRGMGCSEPPSLEARFWSKVDRRGPDECWPWTASVKADGYGLIGAWGRVTGAHRLALILSGIEPPFPGAVARHTCHNPPCCNPAHLLWGTQKDNMQDCVRAGRHPSAKLTPEAIAYIGSSGERGVILARRFGVSQACISQARKRFETAEAE